MRNSQAFHPFSKDNLVTFGQNIYKGFVKNGKEKIKN